MLEPRLIPLEIDAVTIGGKLIKLAARHATKLQIRAQNPLQWLQEVIDAP